MTGHDGLLGQVRDARGKLQLAEAEAETTYERWLGAVAVVDALDAAVPGREPLPAWAVEAAHAAMDGLYGAYEAAMQQATDAALPYRAVTAAIMSAGGAV